MILVLGVCVWGGGGGGGGARGGDGEVFQCGGLS